MQLTKEAAERFFSALTGGGFDNRFWQVDHGDRLKSRYIVRWVFKDVHDNWCQYTIIVPEYEPERFEVQGCKHNPGYTGSAGNRRVQKEVIRKQVADALGRVLRGSGRYQDDAKEEVEIADVE